MFAKNGILGNSLLAELNALMDMDVVKEAKICLVGHNGVGKTCIAHHFATGSFPQDVGPTVGLMFFSRALQIKGSSVVFKLFDVAGHDKYHAISQSYYKGVHAIVAVYDVTDATSFEKMMGWVEEVQSCANKDVILWVVGNKADIKDLKQVSTEEGKSYSTSQGGSFIELSARDNTGVMELFTSLGESLPLDKLPVHDNRPSEYGTDD